MSNSMLDAMIEEIEKEIDKHHDRVQKIYKDFKKKTTIKTDDELDDALDSALDEHLKRSRKIEEKYKDWPQHKSDTDSYELTPLMVYIEKQKEKAKIAYEKVIKKMGEEAGLDYLFGLKLDEDPEDDQYSAIGMEARARYHQDEALALIHALDKCDPNKSTSEVYTIPYKLGVVGNGRALYKNFTHKMTRAEIVERLQWITFEDYGDDIEKWKEWVAFRKEHGFLCTPSNFECD